MEDLQAIPAICDIAAGKMEDSELIFSFPEVLNVIKLCTAHSIAVLGAEIFLILNDGKYQALGFSDYDLEMGQKWKWVQANQWPSYVNESNAHAEETVRKNPRGDNHVYVLTTSSWREFSEIQNAKPR